VVIALVLTTLSLAVLLLHMPSVTTLAGLARTADDAAVRRGGDVLHPALGLLVLIVMTVLNVHKPRGLTPYGQHKQTKEAKGSTKNRAERSTPRPAEVVLLGQNEGSQVPAGNEKAPASVLGPVCAAARRARSRE
jgi:hypothetical protein